MTYDEFRTFAQENDGYYEFIDGKPLLMTMPLLRHGDAEFNLHDILRGYFCNKKCVLYPSPFDVKLSSSINVYQPDFCVICFPEDVTDNGYFGAPDLVIEILSPSTAYIDYGIKKIDYLSNGVREYWIVDPSYKFIEVWNGLDSVVIYKDNDILSSLIFSDLSFDISMVFDKKGNMKVSEYLFNLLAKIFLPGRSDSI